MCPRCLTVWALVAILAGVMILVNVYRGTPQ